MTRIQIIIKMENTDKDKSEIENTYSDLQPSFISSNQPFKPDKPSSASSKPTTESPATLQSANPKATGEQDLPNQTRNIEQEKVYMGKDDNKKLSTYRPKIPFFKEKPPYEDWDTLNHTFNMTRSRSPPPEPIEKFEANPLRQHENEEKDVISLPKVDLSTEGEKRVEKIRGWKRLENLGEKLKIGSKMRDRDTHYYEYSPSLHMPGSDGFTS
jgi:hypothetical protein